MHFESGHNISIKRVKTAENAAIKLQKTVLKVDQKRSKLCKK